MSGKRIVGCRDVMVEIFSNLRPETLLWAIGTDAEDERTQFSRTLASCAITSKSISRHALDTLWYQLEDVTPLLRLLPICRSYRSEWVSTSWLVNSTTTL